MGAHRSEQFERIIVMESLDENAKKRLCKAQSCLLKLRKIWQSSNWARGRKIRSRAKKFRGKNFCLMPETLCDVDFPFCRAHIQQDP